MLVMIGLFGGLLALVSNIPYVKDTIKGKTKPHRITWGIFFLLNMIFIANQLAAGATSSIWLPVAFLISTGIVFSLSLKFGTGGTSKTDLIILSGALMGVVVWQLLDAPLASIIANLVEASIAGIPTFRKSWKQPETETKISYLLGAIAGLITAISVGKLDVILLLLPIYSVIYQGSIFLILNRKNFAKSSPL